MSLTADGEFFKCDMCGVYFHMNIFCSHRRQCKGLDSQEMKKHQVEEVQCELDREARERMKRMAALDPASFTADVPTSLVTEPKRRAERELASAPIERQQQILTSKRNAAWQRKMLDEEEAALREKINSIDEAALLEGFE